MNKESENLGLSKDDLEKHKLNLKNKSALPVTKFIGDINRKKEEEQTEKLAKNLSLPYLNLTNYQPDADVVDIIPKKITQTGKIFAFKKEGKNVYVAISETKNPATVKVLEQLKNQDNYNYIPVIVSPSSMVYLLSIYDIFAPAKRLDGDITLSQAMQDAAADQIKNWTEWTTKLKKISTSKLFETILSGATYAEASDIHIEPSDTSVHIRFRIDGILQDVVDLDITTLKKLISRIKFLSNLKLNITASAQDGRFSIKTDKINYDIRVSVLPTAWGESAVLRLLPQEGNIIDLDKLGLVGNNLKIIESIIKQPNGLILNTGPTGSGKTTTLYSILDKINTPTNKVITIEDPIEYRLPNITQSQVEPDEGYTFANGLRSILRQDPDVILVGEIRDEETAKIAVNASLTGHLVLSTLHTNDAAGAIPRLIDLGLKPQHFIESILAIIAQRLVRRICPNCTQTYTPDETTMAQIKKELATLPANIKTPVFPKTLKKPDLTKAATCSRCNGTGYKGRIGLFEILQTSPEIIKAVLAGSTAGEIKQLAIKNGMVVLKQDGLLKVLEGITTLEEIERVTKKE